MKKRYQGITDSMLSDIKTISEKISHAGDQGRNNELILYKFLEKRLPKRYSVSTGKIVAKGGKESDQIDIIIHDRLNTPELLDSEAWSLVPIESAYAIISVKTTLDKTKLRNAISGIESVRSLPRKAAIRYDTNHVIKLTEDQTLAPRSFIFAFNTSWKKPVAANKAFRDILKEVKDDHRPNGMCILDQCLIVRKPKKTKTLIYSEQVLMHFFIFLIDCINTFPKNQVDLSDYFEIYDKA